MNSGNRTKFAETYRQIYEKWERYLIVLLDNPYSRKFTDGIKKEFVSGMLKELKLPSDNIKINYILDYYASASIALVSKWM